MVIAHLLLLALTALSYFCVDIIKANPLRSVAQCCELI